MKESVLLFTSWRLHVSYPLFCRKFTFNPKEGIDNPVMVITDDAGILRETFCNCPVCIQTWGKVFSIWKNFSVSPCSDSAPTPSPRLCVLKRVEGESYGFHLRVERKRQGHIISNVVVGGVAGCRGLQDGDRLLEVNNCYVDDVPHPEVRWVFLTLFKRPLWWTGGILTGPAVFPFAWLRCPGR